ncbi:MAG: hypothetical protein A3I66_09835 [Burkholderiales bacterium RIFCSPLOWO2_02_FULL_57_36]|nr:MAG: hypothetical protein A3I66_09835 [Burkholderiales bacterium RIFCSPLOWO2_02_FULL_57_36]
MSLNFKMLVLAGVAVIAGCASQQPTQNSAAAANEPVTKPQTSAIAANETPVKSRRSTTPGARVVKSKNGDFDGEVIGTAAPQSKFSKLQIGMSTREVSNLIGVADDELRHETGKRWIPFYFGGDVQRVQSFYKGEGCLTFTAGNQFGAGGRKLIRIHVDPKNECFAG